MSSTDKKKSFLYDRKQKSCLFLKKIIFWMNEMQNPPVGEIKTKNF